MTRYLFLCLGGALLLAGCDSFGSADSSPTSALVFGTENYDVGLDLLQMADGHLVVGGIGDGVLAPADGTIPTPNLTHVGPDGRVRWSRLYEDLQGGALLSVYENGSGYTALIRLGSYADGTSRLRLVSVGPDGRRKRVLYEREGVTVRSNQTLRRTQNGGFILAGATPYTEDPRRGFLVRLDSTGRVQWDQSFDDLVRVQAVVGAGEGGFVLLGETNRDAPSSGDVLLIKVGPEGSEIWRRAYGTEERRERGLAMAASVDGDVTVVGQSVRHGEGNSEEWAYALRVASDGTKQWAATYHGDRTESAAQTVTTLGDKGLMLAGSRTGPEGETDALLIRINEKGEEQWRMTFGREGRIDQARAVTELHDGGLGVTGASGPDEPSFGGADFDVFVRFVSSDTYLDTP